MEPRPLTRSNASVALLIARIPDELQWSPVL